MLNRSITLFALAGILSAPTAMAVDNIYGGLRYEFIDNREGSDSSAYRFELGTELSRGITVDNRTYITDPDEGQTTSRTEIGLTASAPVHSDISLFARASLGYEFDGDYSYSALEVGPKFRANDSLTGTLSYTFGDSFDSDVNSRYNSFYAGAEFALNPNNSIEAGVNYTTDQIEYTSYAVGWNYKF